MKYQSVKGFRDILGVSAETFSFVEKTARAIFRKYNFDEIRIPTVELSDLFLRTIGETTDIVEKEMYVFEDKGKRKIALRPEGTAGVVRAYIENNLSQKYPSQKFFYIGQMFRQERPQSGRFREFSQIGCEYFGNLSVYADIEIILLAKDILESSGIKDVKIEINNLGCEKCRPLLQKNISEIITKLNFDNLCDDCKRRFSKNPFRVLDCKIDGEKFKGFTPKLCNECSSEFEELKNGLKNANLNFTVSNKLVRGLDYYTKTVFEITSDVLGSQSAVCAGGRYDNLVKDLGGATTAAVGFAIGVDRLVEILEKTVRSPKSEAKSPFVFVCATENDDCKKMAFHILSEIRNSGIIADGGYFEKSLKSQMRLADALGTKYAVIIGDEEIKNKKIILRDMKVQQQKEIGLDGAIEEIKKCFNRNS
ncbi:MAG: histidine--tRNA ligase [Elusimicrobia bacterium]|nr:histidine--tRNA ligase [Elusimicrobiota bacterium]